jgi:endogenous inhibitor of DNA gyrase (YacG/DUF329 family)
MQCPICKRSVEAPKPGQGARSYFPFCSERCKLIDLGRWLDGKYRTPVRETDRDHSDANESHLKPET